MEKKLLSAFVDESGDDGFVSGTVLFVFRRF